ncbi:hypothetical protein [uncultured Tenacibaculum sp.]|uniref:hypothetical protein n=1 Tax=uncultured Tenacibaculum sp. TaxID=174713 RepID=UPI00262326B8|nr:hypothetical protein [uncultured Tenacibaculum sp.]
MKSLIVFLFCSASIFMFIKNEKKTAETNPDISYNLCRFKGNKLYGKIRLVEYASQADVRVKIVNSFPDLKVKFVENNADDCGEWEIVEYGEDLKVYITENFPDLKIKPVNSFPGLNR